MNLLDCSIPYFHTVPEILTLRPNALQAALEVQSGISETVPDRMKYELGDLAGSLSGRDGSFMLPTKLDFNGLSYAAKKTLIACYHKAKYSKTPFRIKLTREELAEAAHLSVLHLRKALKELQDRRLVDIKQLWRQGIQASLLDPEYGSGTALYHIAQFNSMKLDSIPAYQWYRALLHDASIPMDSLRMCCGVNLNSSATSSVVINSSNSKAITPPLSITGGAWSRCKSGSCRCCKSRQSEAR
jgi:hypothetical protein